MFSSSLLSTKRIAVLSLSKNSFVLSASSKPLEKIINEGLAWFIDHKDLLNHIQYGCHEDIEPLWLQLMIWTPRYKCDLYVGGASLYSIFFDLEYVFCWV